MDEWTAVRVRRRLVQKCFFSKRSQMGLRVKSGDPRRVFKLILARWRSQAMTKELRERQPIIARLRIQFETPYECSKLKCCITFTRMDSLNLKIGLKGVLTAFPPRYFSNRCKRLCFGLFCLSFALPYSSFYRYHRKNRSKLSETDENARKMAFVQNGFWAS